MTFLILLLTCTKQKINKNKQKYVSQLLSFIFLFSIAFPSHQVAWFIFYSISYRDY